MLVARPLLMHLLPIVLLLAAWCASAASHGSDRRSPDTSIEARHSESPALYAPSSNTVLDRRASRPVLDVPNVPDATLARRGLGHLHRPAVITTEDLLNFHHGHWNRLDAPKLAQLQRFREHPDYDALVRRVDHHTVLVHDCPACGRTQKGIPMYGNECRGRRCRKVYLRAWRRSLDSPCPFLPKSQRLATAGFLINQLPQNPCQFKEILIQTSLGWLMRWL